MKNKSKEFADVKFNLVVFIGCLKLHAWIYAAVSSWEIPCNFIPTAKSQEPGPWEINKEVFLRPLFIYFKLKQSSSIDGKKSYKISDMQIALGFN